MTRLSAPLVALACLALQVPWVQCVADCHERIHPGVGRGHCHAASCDAKRTSDPEGAHDSPRGEAEHISVPLATVGVSPSIVSDLSPGPGFVVPADGSRAGRFFRAVARRAAEPAAFARLSAVLLL